MSLLVLLCLASSSYSLTFECRFLHENFAIVKLTYTCEATVLYSNSETLLENVQGDHSAGLTDRDVKGLNVWNDPYLNQIPQGIGKIFSNIVALQWYDGNLSSVVAADLKQFPKLRVLSLQGNRLHTIYKDLFQDNLKLNWISFSKNVLEHVEPDLLAPLTVLKTASFYYNRCIHMEATSPEEIEDLSLQLSEKCQMLIETPPEPEECFIGCMSRIETLKLQFQAESDKLQKQITELLETNKRHGERIDELEMLMKV